MGASNSLYSLPDDRLRERIRRKVLLSKSKYGVSLSTTQYLDRVFEETKVVGSGDLNFEDFLHVAAVVGIEATVPQIEFVFGRFDKNGDGSLSKDEFMRFVHKSKSVSTNNAHDLPSLDVERDVKDRLMEFNLQLKEMKIEIAEAETVTTSWDAWDSKNQEWHNRLSAAVKRAEVHKAREATYTPHHHSKPQYGTKVLNIDHLGSNVNNYFENLARMSTAHELYDSVQLSDSDLLMLCNEFCVGSKVDTQYFIDHLLHMHPQIHHRKALLLRLSVLFQRGKRGMDVASLVIGVCKVLRCSLESKVEIFIAAHGSRGYVTACQLRSFFTREQFQLLEQFSLSKSYLMSMDVDGDEQLSMVELADALRKNKVLLTSMARSLPCPIRAMHVLEQLVERETLSTSSEEESGRSWSFESLQAIWQDFGELDGATREKARKMSKRQFREFVNRYFCDVDDAPLSKSRTLVDALFAKLVQTSATPNEASKTRLSGRPSIQNTCAAVAVDIVDVLRALVVLLAPNDMELVCFYFGLFDRNGDGGIDEKELELVLRVTKRELAQGHERALSSLLKCESKGTERLTKTVLLSQPPIYSLIHRHLM